MYRHLLACLAVTFISTYHAQAEETASYTRQRYAELTARCWEPNRDLDRALLAIASGDPEKVALGEQDILRRIRIGREHIGFFKIDIILAYRLYKKRFSPEAQKAIEQWILAQLKPGSTAFGRQFVHANDNWPFVASYLFILGGEMVDRDDLVREGIVRLEAYLDLCRELGVGSEYNSPTYNPLSLCCVECIAGLSRNLRARVVARVIAERLWTEIALRFHSPSQQFAAPHSRAYMRDTLCLGSPLRYTLHPLLPNGVVTDEASAPKMKVGLTTVPENSLIRHFLAPYLVAIFEHKPFPYETRARKYRSFTLDGPDAWPAGFFDTITYMTKTYAVGSAQRTYGTGSGTTPFQAYWTLAKQTRKPGDYRTLYVRYRVNDALPLQKNEIWLTGEERPTTVDTNILREDGYINPVQHKSTTMVLYRPRQAQNGHMKSLCATVLIPAFWPLDKIYLDSPNGPIVSLPMRSEEPRSVLIQDADCYVAVLPLAVTNHGRRECMRIERVNRHLLISFYNLQSDSAVTWSAEEFLKARNGFVIDIGDGEEFESFEKFARIIRDAKVSDDLEDGTRTVRYIRRNRSMTVRLNVRTHQYLQRTFDGVEYKGPLMVSPHTVASFDDTIRLGDAVLSSGPGEPKWLTVEPTTGTYSVLHPFRWRLPLKLTTPRGTLVCEGFRMGRIVYRPAGETVLRVDCERAPEPLRFSRLKRQFRVVLNDEEVTDRVRSVRNGWLELSLPGNDRPKVPPGRLDVQVMRDFAPLANGEHGRLTTIVRNVGGCQAVAVRAAPYFHGFARNILPTTRYVESIPPGGEAQWSWSITGVPAGMDARVRMVVTCDSAPTVEATSGAEGR